MATNWTGLGDGMSWDDSSNWDNDIPGSNDLTAVISGPGVVVTMGITLDFSAGWALLVDTGATLLVVNSLTISAGVVTIDGTLSISAALRTTGTGLLTNNGLVNEYLGSVCDQDGGTITNNGTWVKHNAGTINGSGVLSRDGGTSDFSNMTAGTNVTFPSGAGAVNWW